ncbi:aldo/keto reductase [Chryseolinea lacunae]|uniref:Aldo/keto reductase n=1 Tax=Chryseolinea lacunae TaxID=2801331 RepID=A0ABS1KLT3_9BACT|nr:aldo/keto reductase [Chryseolinea lacunae]MBL0740429.1 aldo/keto reductase [Chryseolinea lacunae]
MDYRQLGGAGMRVPVLSLGTGTFGGTNDFFKRWGTTDEREATRLIDVSLAHGMNFFDTANVYSMGDAEKILGHALKGKRHDAIVSTKATFSMGAGTNDQGSSRYHILKAADESLKRLGTDYIDLYFMHGFDATTPIDETLRTLDDLIRSGKVRYVGASNFAGWQLMKALSVSEREHLSRYVIYQGYYSLIGRDYEWELLPLIQDQKLGLQVWSPLGWGRLTGKIKSGQPLPEGRIKSGGDAGGPNVPDALLFSVLAVLEQLAEETGKSVSQIALNWLLQRPTVSNIVIGARNEEQLIQNLGAVGWSLTPEQVQRLDAAGAQKPMYPHWVGAR